MAVTIPHNLAMRILDGLENEWGGSREARELRQCIEDQAGILGVSAEDWNTWTSRCRMDEDSLRSALGLSPPQEA